MATRKTFTKSSANPAIIEGLSAAQILVVERFLVETTGPFRRGDLTARLLRLLRSGRGPQERPRKKADNLAASVLRQLARKLAASALRQLANAGRIRRHGHQHWIVCTATRVLRDGSVVPETQAPVTLSLTTRCPQKWLAVDLETGEVWAGSERGTWRREALGALKVVSCAD